MATLFNTKISQTYEGLLKTIDNAAITATLKQLTDGSGNQSGLFLNTAGDFKVNAILEWGSLKDSGTGVTITQFVTAANGIENFNNDTTLPTSAAVKLYVDTKFSQTDTLTEVLGFGNTTSGKDIAVSAGDDITFTDTSKAIFGTSSEFEIFQDTADSRITTSSNLYIQTPIFRVQKTGGESMIQAFTDGAVQLFFNGVKKIETTLLGSTVTGDLLVTGTITGAGGSFLPLAGGTMTGNTIHNDNVKSIYGTLGDGLEIFHDGNNSLIKDTGTGNLTLDTNGDQINFGGGGENFAVFRKDTSVDLFYNGLKKFETTNTGVLVTGALSTTTNVLVGANATFVDNGKAIFGTGSDLQISHDGTDSFIEDTGTGSLYVTTDAFRLLNPAENEQLITAFENGAVNLFFNGTKRIETVTAGAKVTGNLEVTGTITGSGGSFLPLAGGTMTGNTIHNDNVKSIYGTASDGLEIVHDGGNSRIKDTGTGSLVLSSSSFFIQNGSGNLISGSVGGTVELTFNGASKLATVSTGISVTGNASLSGGFSMPDNQFGKFGTADDIIIGHDATNSIIRSSTGDFFIDQAAGTQSINFRTSNNSPLDTTALIINRSGDLITGKDVTIAGDLTVNGTTTTVNSQTLSVVDPLISLATANAANSLDIGFYGKYNNGTARYLGLYNDASDSNKFKLFKNTTIEPVATVSQAGGYEAADLVVAGLEATSLTNTGDLLVEDNIYLTDAGTTRAKIQLNSSDRDNLDIKAVSLGSTMNFFTADTLALSLNASQNASFAGDVTINKATPILTLNSSNVNVNQGIVFSNAGTFDASIKHGASSADMFIEVGRNSTWGGAVLFKMDTYDSYFISRNSHVFKILGVEKFKIDSSGNSTFSGNVTATNRLTVAGAGTGSPYLDFTQSGVEKAYLQYVDSGDNLAIQSDGIITFRTAANAEKMRITSAGDVLISKTALNVGTVGTEFRASGQSVFTANGDNAVDLNRLTNDGAIALFRKDNAVIGSIGSNTAGGQPLLDIAGATGNSNIRFLTTNTERMRITSTGNVGIGTGAPQRNLTVFASSGNAVLQLVNATSGIGSSDGFLVFTNGVDVGLENKENGNLSFATNATEKMRITSVGNVGIGTTTPQTKLHVLNTLGTNNAIFENSSQTYSFTAIKVNEALNNKACLTFAVGDNLASTDIISEVSGVVTSNGGNLQGAMTFKTNQGDNLTERMRIDASGKVGINTTTPGGELEVNGTIRVGNSSGGLFLRQSGGKGEILGLNNTGVSYVDLSLRSNTAVQLYLKTNGNVGIGTSTPNAKFQVKTATNQNIAFNLISGGDLNGIQRITSFNDAVSASVPLGIGASELHFLTGAGSLERMRITSTGLVKINPGTANNTSYDALVLTGGANSTSGSGAKMYLSGTVNDPLARGTIIEGVMTNNTNAHALLFSTSASSSAPTERMRIDSSGFVTIKNTPNTTGASLTLENQGDVDINETIGYLNFRSTDASTASSGGVGGIGVYAEEAFNTSFTPSYMSFYTHQRTNNNGTTLGNVTERMRINSSGVVDIKNVGAAGTPSLVFGGDTDTGILKPASNTLAFSTFGNERMRITPGGVVEAKAGFSATNGTAFVNVRDNGDGGVLSSEDAAKTIGMCAGSNYASGANFAFIKFTGGASSAVVVRSNNNGVQLTRNSTAWTSASDETLKENIKPLENVLDKIQNYRCVEYNFKTDKDKKIGFIAQDWENDFAPIVDKDEEGLLSMKYTETIPVLLKAIQELKAEIELLKAK